MVQPAAREGTVRLETALFAAAVFAAAFLIFGIQPLVAKRILPWFGGSPAVWMICLAFYQTTLFIGYVYAHVLIRFASPWLQFGIHAGLLALAAASLPVLPDGAWKPSGQESPSWHIVSMLLANVAVPFASLAATGPLVQAWFARRHTARSPYPLYAVSNLGSLLALVAFPFWIEPNLPVTTAGAIWSWAFFATGLPILACAFLARRVSSGPAPARSEPLSANRIAVWVALAGTAVIVLMSVSSRLTLDLASVPFLWVLPLALYLMTLIWSFSSDGAYRRGPWLGIFAVATLAVAAAPVLLSDLLSQIVLYTLLLFSGCMLMHGELFRLRPAADSLTAFYLCVAGGGALGGLFTGLVAPGIFNDHSELELGTAMVWGLSFLICRRDPESWAYRERARWHQVVAGAASVLLVVAPRLSPDGSVSELEILRERTFFGVLRIDEGGPGRLRQRQLTSGTTLHGMQLLDPARRHLPTTYYGVATPVGVLLSSRAPDRDTRVGVVGLGIGTLASYGRPGDRFRFYEIDPVVIRIARDPAYFDFVSQSAAEVEIVEGDGRLSLERENAVGGEGRFDILVVDAFSSDAIPVHLLTREAFATYLEAMADDGVLAIHASSRHFDLASVVARLGSEAGLSGVDVTNRQQPGRLSAASRWLVLSASGARIDGLVADLERDRRGAGIARRAFLIERFTPQHVTGAPLWSDDFSDLLGSLQFRADSWIHWLPEVAHKFLMLGDGAEHDQF